MSSELHLFLASSFTVCPSALTSGFALALAHQASLPCTGVLGEAAHMEAHLG